MLLGIGRFSLSGLFDREERETDSNEESAADPYLDSRCFEAAPG